MFTWIKKVARQNRFVGLAPPILTILLLTAHSSQLIAFANENEQTYYYLHDHLGGIEAVLDEDGNVVERRDYLPFGNIRTNVNPREAGPHDEVIAPLAGGEEAYGFTGKELDSEADLMYFDQRYYDPEIGRFLSIDPLALGESDKPLESILKNPQASNSYSYVINNPLKYVDPKGLWNILAHHKLTQAALKLSDVEDSWKKEHSNLIKWGATIYADIIKKGDYSYHSTTPNGITNGIDLKERMLENAEQLYSSNSDSDFGRLLHMVQDSYCPSHVKRDKDGNIEAFYDYEKQSLSKHLKGDKPKNADLNSLIGAIKATERLIEYRANKDTKWDDVKMYLNEEIWTLREDVTVGTAGEEYKKD